MLNLQIFPPFLVPFPCFTNQIHRSEMKKRAEQSLQASKQVLDEIKEMKSFVQTELKSIRDDLSKQSVDSKRGVESAISSAHACQVEMGVVKRHITAIGQQIDYLKLRVDVVQHNIADDRSREWTPQMINEGLVEPFNNLFVGGFTEVKDTAVKTGVVAQ